MGVFETQLEPKASSSSASILSASSLKLIITGLPVPHGPRELNTTDLERPSPPPMDNFPAQNPGLEAEARMVVTEGRQKLRAGRSDRPS
jgi:hypothetical protein